jgi:hypothetical protein
MMEDFQPLPAPEEARSGRRRQWLAVGVLLVVGVAVVGLWFTQTTPQNPPSPIPETLPPLGPEQQAYGEKIEIGRLELSRWANFLGQEVVYLDGVVTNQGDRSIVAVDVTLEFKDPYGQVVLRQTIRPIGERLSTFGAPQGPLPAGESRSFRAGFEHMPADWNQGGPEVTISGLLLQ